MKAGILAAAAALLLPLAADAQSYRCVTKDGKKLYGSTIPPQCFGQPVEQLNKQGMVVKRIDPEAEKQARKAKQAAEAEKAEQKSGRLEEDRRNNALLATYTSTKDIEDAHARVKANTEKTIRTIEARIEQLRASKADTAQAELKQQEQLLEAKQKELAQIDARFDEDKKRFARLTGGKR
jgi:molecular chaperone DnaK (HSP70)